MIIILLCVVSVFGVETIQGFTGIFAPGNWQSGSNAPGGVSLVDVSRSPDSITIMNYDPWAVSGATFVFPKSPSDGTISFSYKITGGTQDCPGSYSINKKVIILPNYGNSITFSITAGDSFGFALNGQNLPNDFGCKCDGRKVTLMVSNFVFTYKKVLADPPAGNIPVTGVSLNQTSIKLTAGGSSGQLTASIIPSNATNKNVTWTSNNQSVATVNSSGMVTPVAAGTALITVKTSNGGFSATSSILVGLKSLSWSQQKLPGQHWWSSPAYGNGIFVTVAYNTNVVATSADAVNRNKNTMPDSQYWSCVAYGNNCFIALTNGSVAARSTDGITWTKSSLPCFRWWTAIAYGNSLFVAVASGNASKPTDTLLTSSDGITWNQRTLPSAQKWNSITYGNGRFVATSISNIAAISSNGINWTQQSLPISQLWYSVTYGNGLYVAVSNSNIAATSTDGITWTQQSLPSSRCWGSVTFGDGLFVAVAQGYVAISTNGVSWTQQALPCCNNQQWYNINYGNSRYIVIQTSENVVRIAVKE